MYHRRGRGGAAVGNGGVVTVQIRPMVAKCTANQEALDRLQEVRIKAEQNPNSKFVFTIKRAMKSLKDCTHPVVTLQDALALKYVGDRLAKLIVPHIPVQPSQAPKRPNSAITTDNNDKNNKKSKSTNNSTNPLLQSTLAPLPPTAAATNTAVAAANKKAPAPVGPTAKEKAYFKAKEHASALALPDGPWKVLLLIDGREHNSKQVVSRCRQSGIPCEERNLPIGDMAWIARWDPEQNGGPSKTALEILLGTIMERKEVSDFASSIFGTRFLEQRLRLQQSGLPQVLYLVEGDLNLPGNCPAETMRMAMMETRVQTGFSVIQTKHLQDTVLLLKGLHRRVVQRTFPDAFCENLPTYNREAVTSAHPKKRRRPTSLLEQVFDTPPVPPFGDERFLTYKELKTKVERDREAGTKSVGAIFGAMLKQVATFSQKKCQAVAVQYPTLHSLMQAYETSDRPAHLIQDVACGRQRIGPKSSAELHVVCGTQRDGTLAKTANGGTHIRRQPNTTATLATCSNRFLAATTTTTTTTTAALPLRERSLNLTENSVSVAATLKPAPLSRTIPSASQHSVSSSCLDLTQDTPPRSNIAGSCSPEDSPELDDDEFFARLAREHNDGRPHPTGTATAEPVATRTLASASVTACKPQSHTFQSKSASPEISSSLSILSNNDASSVDTFQTPAGLRKMSYLPPSSTPKPSASLLASSSAPVGHFSTASKRSRTFRDSLGSDGAPLFSSPSTYGGPSGLSSQESMWSAQKQGTTKSPLLSQTGSGGPHPSPSSSPDFTFSQSSNSTTALPNSQKKLPPLNKSSVPAAAAAASVEDAILLLDSSSDESDADERGARTAATSTSTSSSSSSNKSSSIPNENLQARVARLLGNDPIVIE